MSFSYSTYSKCITQSNKLLALANEYRSLYSYINAVAVESLSYWNGLSNDAFREEIAQWKKEAVSIRAEMEDLSILIRNVARQLLDED